MPFQKEYLKRTLAIVDGLASISSKQVIENIYNSEVKSFKNGVGKKN